MTIDTLAYSKHLEAAGVDRHAAEAQAEALGRYLLPELVTKSDLAATRLALEHTLAQTKTDLEQAIERVEHRLTIRLIGIIGAFNAALFALLRFIH